MKTIHPNLRAADFMTRKHNRSHFYKYVSCDSAKEIIRSRKLKWSCPLEFNDPYDHHIQFFKLDNLDNFNKKIIHRMAELIFDRDDVRFDTTDAIGMILERSKGLRNKMSKVEYIEHMEDIIGDMTSSFNQAYINLAQKIKELLQETRVFCVSEVNDNLLMWSHYSASHTGVVFKFKCIDELDNALLSAGEVTYKEKPPLLATENEWIDHFLHVKRFYVGDRYNELIFTKSDEWKYEKEWRISIPLAQNGSSDPMYIPENKGIFEAVYLGCKISDKCKKDIITLANQYLPNMETWQVKKSETEYKLEFNKISE